MQTDLSNDMIDYFTSLVIDTKPSYLFKIERILYIVRDILVSSRMSCCFKVWNCGLNYDDKITYSLSLTSDTKRFNNLVTFVYYDKIDIPHDKLVLSLVQECTEYDLFISDFINDIIKTIIHFCHDDMKKLIDSIEVNESIISKLRTKIIKNNDLKKKKVRELCMADIKKTIMSYDVSLDEIVDIWELAHISKVHES